MQTIRYPREQMHRIAYTKLTERQIADALEQVQGPSSASTLSDVFAGRDLEIVTDSGPTLSYRFASANRLTIAAENVAAGYGALLLDDVALITHLVPGTQRAFHVVVDRATVFEAWFSGCGAKASSCAANAARSCAPA